MEPETVESETACAARSIDARIKIIERVRCMNRVEQFFFVEEALIFGTEIEKIHRSGAIKNFPVRFLRYLRPSEKERSKC